LTGQNVKVASWEGFSNVVETSAEDLERGGFFEGQFIITYRKNMVPAVGIEPTRSQAPRDFECENRFFPNP
jgi:hypothetical protein